MPPFRRLAGRTTVGLLLIVLTAACRSSGPDLVIDIDNDGPKDVTVTLNSSGLGMTGGEDLIVRAGTGAGWSMPLGSTWEVKVDDKHVIGSGDRTDLALPSSGQRQDLMIRIQVAADGTVRAAARQPSPSS